MNIAYWIVTGLLAAFLLITGIADLIRLPEAVVVFKHLGYPEYLLPFIGVAKVLAAIAIVFPRFPALKEWAYAGLTFDIVGAFYSHIAVGDPIGQWMIPAVALGVVIASYFLYHKSRSIGPND
ncbi:MAG: DoxX family protein [Pyrinomonadaceae bacterium]